MRIRSLGRFVIEREGRDITPPPGLPTRIVEILVASGGGLHADVLVEWL